jgi:UDP-N-acetyl-L-fucosamine synthase
VSGSLRVATVVGTRPEVIRLSRVLPRLDAAFDHYLVHTGQNYDYSLNQIFFDELRLRPPDRYLGVDTSSLGHVLGGTLIGVEEVLHELRPDALLVLGDTNSCIAALMARRMHIPVFHMEAGNRCFDANVPEETNRRLVDHVSDFNLVYTEHARRNLLAEGLHPRRILLTGSPMAEVLDYYAPEIAASTVLERLQLEPSGYLLVSAHREETVDNPDRLRELLSTLAAAGKQYDRPVLVSTHPRTRKRLGGIEESVKGVRFHEPFGFFDYVRLQQDAYCVFSDSGTISEESVILGFPAITLRDSIERPEALEAGGIITTGLDLSVVLDAVDLLVAQRSTPERPYIPAEYQIRDTSLRVANIIQSTAHVHRRWEGIQSLQESSGSSTLGSGCRA